MGKGSPTARELAPGSEWDVSEKEWAVFKNVMSTRDKTQVKAVFCRATMRLWLWIRQQLREEGGSLYVLPLAHGFSHQRAEENPGVRNCM